MRILQHGASQQRSGHLGWLFPPGSTCCRTAGGGTRVFQHQCCLLVSPTLKPAREVSICVLLCMKKLFSKVVLVFYKTTLLQSLLILCTLTGAPMDANRFTEQLISQLLRKHLMPFVFILEVVDMVQSLKGYQE